MSTDRPEAVTVPTDARFETAIAPFTAVRLVVPPLLAVSSDIPLLPEIVRMPPATTGPAEVTDPLVLVRLTAPGVLTPPAS